MSKKIRLLFEELSKTYPNVINDEFVKRVTEAIDEAIASEVTDRVTESKKEDEAKLRKELSEEMKASGEQDMEKLVNMLDVYCENAVSEFCNDNKDLLSEATKSTVSSRLAEKITEVFSTYGVMTEDSRGEVDELRSEVQKLNTTVNSLSENNVELSNEIKKLNAISIVDSVCSEMSEENTLKFYKLIEDYDIDDADEFRKKVESLAEMLEGKKADDGDGGEKKLTKDMIKGGEGDDDDNGDDDEDDDKKNEDTGGSVLNSVRRKLRKTEK